MKKLIITILALATIALAENKPICYDKTEDPKGRVKTFVCRNPSNDIDSTIIGVEKDMSYLILVHHYSDGRGRIVSGRRHNKGYTNEYVTIEELEHDEFGVWVKDTSSTVTHTLEYYYKSLRRKYDFRKK